MLEMIFAALQCPNDVIVAWPLDACVSCLLVCFFVCLFICLFVCLFVCLLGYPDGTDAVLSIRVCTGSEGDSKAVKGATYV